MRGGAVTVIIAQHHVELRHNVTYSSCWGTNRWTDEGQPASRARAAESDKSLAQSSPPSHGGYGGTKAERKNAASWSDLKWQVITVHPGFFHTNRTK